MNIKKEMTMKTNIWKLLLALMVVLPVFTACDDDDDYYYIHNGDMWTTYGNLERIDNGSRQKYAIRLDDGDRLIVTEGIGFTADAEDEGARVHLRYAYVGSERNETGLDTPMDYYIRLYEIDEVLCKQPVKQSFILADEEHRTDSIGNDPIEVTEAWLGGKYLNVEFEVPVKHNSTVQHFINLVQDDVESHNDTVYVYLRHNAYEDAIEDANGRTSVRDYRWMGGRVSFDLTSILPDGETSVPVKFIWTAFGKNLEGTVEKHDSGIFRLSSAQDEEGTGLNKAVEEVSENAQEFVGLK